jgi:HK97 family phage major capsid protein
MVGVDNQPSSRGNHMFIELLKDMMGQKAGARVELDDDAARGLITSGHAKPLADDPIQKAIEAQLPGFTENLCKGMNSAMELVLKEFAKKATLSRKNGVPAIFGEGNEGDVKKTFGCFLLSIRNRDHKSLEAMGSRFVDWDTKAALNTQTGVEGGYTVPEQHITDLLQIAGEASIVQKRATKIPMTSGEAKIPALNVTTAPTAGETAFLGGIQANWTEEANTMSEEEPTFKEVKLVAHELSGYTKASNALLADNAIGLEALLKTLFGRAIAWHKDYGFLRGNGVGKPLGILNADALISVTRSAASAFALQDAAGMLGRLLPGGTSSSIVWAIHPTVLVKLLTMTDGQNVVFIDNARAKPTMVLFGYDVEVTEKLPALNTLGDVLLLDLQHYLVGDRQDIEIAFSEHVAFLTNQGTWRFVARTDGQPWMRDKITLADGTNTLSPFVGLAAG